MNNGDFADLLVDEVRDLLGTSSVGLYEFIWILRSWESDQTLEALRQSAATALEKLLDFGEGRLVLMKWPSEDIVSQYDLQVWEATKWEDPVPHQPYIAIARN